MKYPVLERLLAYSFVLVIGLMLSGCGEAGGGSSGTAPPGNQLIQPAVNPERSIMETVYLNKRVPDSFYTENLPKDAFYSISNVKNVELLPAASRPGKVRYELSTNSFSEALGWSETVAGHMPEYKQLVANSETDLYFQFTRVNLNNPKFIHLSRVFKKSALDRSGIDLNQPGNFHGIINLRPISTEQVKKIVEYLWTFSFSNNYGNAVLESKTSENSTVITHTLMEARLTINTSGSCDVIGLHETKYTVDKSTGEIWSNQIMVRKFFAKYENNQYYSCNS